MSRARYTSLSGRFLLMEIYAFEHASWAADMDSFTWTYAGKGSSGSTMVEPTYLPYNGTNYSNDFPAKDSRGG